MATYEYRCKNEKCKKEDEVVLVTKPMSESSTEETCECGEKMFKVFGNGGCKTFSDGYRS